MSSEPSLLAVGLLLIAISYSAGYGSEEGSIEGLTAGIQSTGTGFGTGGYLIADNQNFRQPEMVFSVGQINKSFYYYAYAKQRAEKCGSFGSECGETGIRILNKNKTKHTTVYKQRVKTRANSEIHDVELHNNTFYLTDLENEKIIQINRRGEVLWRWNASSIYRKPDNPKNEDWLHINDVDVFNGSVLISVRNKNQLVKLDKNTGVTEIINQAGDPEKFNGQHNPQMLNENSVLVADSLNNRIVELQQSPRGYWNVTWEVRSVDNQRLDWPRDADRLDNGNTVITDTRNSRIVVVNETGAVQDKKEFKSKTNLYEADIKGGENYPAPAINKSNEHANTGKNKIYSLVAFLSPVTPKDFATPHFTVFMTGIFLAVLGGWDRWKQE